MHLVVVSPAGPFALQVISCFQIGDDALNRTLGDSDPHRYVPQFHIRISGDQKQHMGVIA